MSAGTRTARAPSLPRVLGPIRPRPRWLELRLLVFVAVALVAGSLSLAAIPRLPLELIELVAVRTAACRGGRHGRVCPDRVAAIAHAIEWGCNKTAR